jgi:hypothetical protein
VDRPPHAALIPSSTTSDGTGSSAARSAAYRFIRSMFTHRNRSRIASVDTPRLSSRVTVPAGSASSECTYTTTRPAFSSSRACAIPNQVFPQAVSPIQVCQRPG